MKAVINYPQFSEVTNPHQTLDSIYAIILSLKIYVEITRETYHMQTFRKKQWVKMFFNKQASACSNDFSIRSRAVVITHEQKTKIPLKGHLDLDLLGEFFIITINLAGALSASISSILEYTSKENNQKILVIIVTTFQVKLKKFYKYGKFKFLIILASRQ